MAELTFRDFAGAMMQGNVDAGGVVLQTLLGLDAGVARTAAAHFLSQMTAAGPAFMAKAMGLRTAVASGARDDIAAVLRDCFALDGAAIDTAVTTLTASKPS
jgi:hypothetical protein